jgi:hypothetical protein
LKRIFIVTNQSSTIASKHIEELSSLPLAWHKAMPYVCCGSFTGKMCALLVEINKGNAKHFTPDVVDHLIQFAEMSSHISCETSAIDVLSRLNEEGALHLTALQYIKMKTIAAPSDVAEKISAICHSVPLTVRAELLRIKFFGEEPKGFFPMAAVLITGDARCAMIPFVIKRTVKQYFANLRDLGTLHYTAG